MSLYQELNRLFYDFSLNELRKMNNDTLFPNISYNSLLYLDLISHKEQCTVSYLAEILHISKPAVTLKVNELIKQGLVVKTQSQSDRRVYYITVSEAVAEDYRQYDQRLQSAVEALEQAYGPKERALFSEMVGLIRHKYLTGPE